MKDTGTGDIKKSNAAFVEAHTYDIAQAGAEHTDDTMKMDATTLNSAIQKACGDNKQKFKLVYCHSAVATNLENLKLLAYLKYTDAQGIERDLEMGTWNGRLVIIDDSLPTKVVEAVAEDTGKGIKAQDAWIKSNHTPTTLWALWLLMMLPRSYMWLSTSVCVMNLVSSSSWLFTTCLLIIWALSV